MARILTARTKTCHQEDYLQHDHRTKNHDVLATFSAVAWLVMARASGIFLPATAQVDGKDGCPCNHTRQSGRRWGRRVPSKMQLLFLSRACDGQSRYSALLAAQATTESDAFGDLERWIAEHLRNDLPMWSA